MYNVFTTLNNRLTKEIFEMCLLRRFDECAHSLRYNVVHYDDKTYKRVFEFVWFNGIKDYYKTLHNLKRKKYTRLQNEFFNAALESINRCIQFYKQKGGVLR